MVLDPETKKYLQEVFKEALEDEVELGFIEDPRVNKETYEIGKELLKELEELSEDKIKVNFYNKDEKKEFCEREEACGPIIFFEKYPNVRYYGLPSGEEFGPFIEEIIEVSHGHVHLPPKAQEIVEKINKPIKLLIFITPSCPHCPRAVVFSHKAAMLNPNITSEMIEAYEYPHWAEEYNVQAVPRNVVLNKEGKIIHDWEGAPYDPADFYQILYEGIKDYLESNNGQK